MPDWSEETGAAHHQAEPAPLSRLPARRTAHLKRNKSSSFCWSRPLKALVLCLAALETGSSYRAQWKKLYNSFKQYQYKFHLPAFPVRSTPPALLAGRA
jgi:hypothetical protein